MNDEEAAPQPDSPPGDAHRPAAPTAAALPRGGRRAWEIPPASEASEEDPWRTTADHFSVSPAIPSDILALFDDLSAAGSRDSAPAGVGVVRSTAEEAPSGTGAGGPEDPPATVRSSWLLRLGWVVLGILVVCALIVIVVQISQPPLKPSTATRGPESGSVPPSPDVEPASPDQGPADPQRKDDRGGDGKQDRKRGQEGRDGQGADGQDVAGAPGTENDQATNASGGATGGGSGSGGTSVAPERADQEPATDFLWADGSVDPDDNPWWSQSTVVVRTTTRLTELKVVVRIIQTGGVASTGTWSSLGDKVNVASAANSEQLAYVVTLNEGATVEPGTYYFKFQYNHDEGERDAGRDRYNVTATSADSTTEYLMGDFVS